MKKLKKLLLIALFSVSTLVMIGTVNASSEKSLFVRNGDPTNPSVKRDIRIICDPKAIENGQTSKCYLIGTLMKASDADGYTEANGFTTQVYTTKYLKIVGATHNPGITGAATTLVTASTTSGTSGVENAPDAPDSLVNGFRCAYDSAEASKKGVIDYRCAIFYSKKSTAKNVFSLTTLRNGADTLASKINAERALAQGSGLGYIGSYEVKLDAGDKDIKECGEICVKVWEIPQDTDYDKCASGSASADCKPVNDEYLCKELGMINKPDDPTPPPPTGAFASYAVLAAGALIAIGAVAMAKKNNKFNRV